MGQPVIVVDGPCGCGKTSWAIQTINDHPETPHLYITPFLDEITRIRKACGDFKRFSEPHNYTTSKSDDFSALLADGCDVAVTHTTFLTATEETVRLIKQGGYSIIIDEVLDVIQDFNNTQIVQQDRRQAVSSGDIQMLLDGKFIKVDEVSHRVEWIGDDYADGKFAEVRRMANLNRLYCVRSKMLVATFPPEIFLQCENIVLLTYLFSGSAMESYFQVFGIPYEFKSIRRVDGRYTMTTYDSEIDTAFRKKCQKLITVHSPTQEYRATALSKSWYDRSSKDETKIKPLQSGIRHFLAKVGAKASNDDVMWTAPSDYKQTVAGKGYTTVRRLTAEERNLPATERELVEKRLDCFVACNARSTNDFGNRWALVYTCNLFFNPVLRGFFDDYGSVQKVGFSDDAFAISCLVQWVFRSRIRNGQPIHLYIPSTRMRRLFEEWLYGNEDGNNIQMQSYLAG